MYLSSPNLRLFLVKIETRKVYVRDGHELVDLSPDDDGDGRRGDHSYYKELGHCKMGAKFKTEEVDLAPVREIIEDREDKLDALCEEYPELHYNSEDIKLPIEELETEPIKEENKTYKMGEISERYFGTAIVCIRLTPKGQCVESARWDLGLDGKINVGMDGFISANNLPEEEDKNGLLMEEAMFQVQDILEEAGILDERFAL